ncbi:hypothetical protein HanPSC8_Chr14g0600181 [Helianthus annuus]|nr:hypothetical protein HanPSC8_Chr14g0600181 [Helianthus annuus]
MDEILLEYHPLYSSDSSVALHSSLSCMNYVWPAYLGPRSNLSLVQCSSQIRMNYVWPAYLVAISSSLVVHEFLNVGFAWKKDILQFS